MVDDMQAELDGLVDQMETEQPGWDVIVDVFEKANVGNFSSLTDTELRIVKLTVKKTNFQIEHHDCYSDAVMGWVRTTPKTWSGFWTYPD